MLCSYTLNKSLRLKIENTCNLRCGFCHAEGNCNADRMTIDQIHEILDFSDRYGYSKIHLTGGEPTLHPQIDKIVRVCTIREKNCAITSNGQCRPAVIEKLISAGLQNINFSLPTIRPDSWSILQDNVSTETSAKQIGNVLSSIRLTIRRGLRTKLNIIIGDSADEAIEVIEYLSRTSVEIRLLNALGNNKALVSINEVLAYYDACLLDEIATMGSSQVKRIYDSKVGRLIVKVIVPFNLPSICKDCEIRCDEGVYGLRFEVCGGKVFARFCVQRKTGRAIVELSDLPDSDQFREIYHESGIAMINRKEAN